MTIRPTAASSTRQPWETTSETRARKEPDPARDLGLVKDGVVIEAEHSCMTLRGVQALGSSTITSTMLGMLREDPRSRAEFFALAGVCA
jgi:hypothetical protein